MSGNKKYGLIFLLISFLLIFNSLVLTPRFVEIHLSPDKSIEIRTYQMIQVFRILFVSLGTSLFGFSLFALFFPLTKIKDFFVKNTLSSIPVIFLVSILVTSGLFYCSPYRLMILPTLLYAMLIMASYVCFLYRDRMSYRGIIISVFLIGLGFRVLTSIIFFGTYDLQAYIRMYHSLETGSNIYTSTDYNYPPVWLCIIGIVGKLCKLFGIPFFIGIKYPIIIADIFIFLTLIFYLKGLNIQKKPYFLILAGFFLNPLSTMVSSYHPQFCNLSILFLLLACYRYFRNEHNVIGTGILTGISVAVKQFTVLCVPIFFFRYKKFISKLVFILLSLVFFFSILLPYFLISPNEVINNIFKYDGLQGKWGFSLLIQLISKLMPGSIKLDINNPYLKGIQLIIMLGVIIFVSFKTRKTDITRSILLVFLSFYVFTYGFGIQYLIWVLPFAALLRERYLKHYTIIGSLTAFCYYYSWSFKEVFLTIFGLFTWVMCIIWLIDNKKYFIEQKN